MVHPAEVAGLSRDRSPASGFAQPVSGRGRGEDLGPVAPNRARNCAAKSPRWTNPHRSATSVTVVSPGAAVASSSRARSSRCWRSHWAGVVSRSRRNSRCRLRTLIPQCDATSASEIGSARWSRMKSMARRVRVDAAGRGPSPVTSPCPSRTVWMMRSPRCWASSARPSSCPSDGRLSALSIRRTRNAGVVRSRIGRSTGPMCEVPCSRPASVSTRRRSSRSTSWSKSEPMSNVNSR